MPITYGEIEALITDSRFQLLKYKQEKANIFNIVGQTHTEHWHSSFMSWLLDPNSSLHLGHFPLARLLNLYMIKNEKCPYSLNDIYSWDLDALHFVTEKDSSFDGKKRSIDVYGESEDLVIVIENKVNARENYNNSDVGQTKDYYDYVERHKKPGQLALYFFITPDIRQESYADMYQQITYQEMYDSIISKCIEHPQVPSDSKYLLEQYADNLREGIHNSKYPMALTNINLCKELYDEHSELFDAIYNAVNGSIDLTNSTDPACIVYHRYKGVFDEIYLSVDERFDGTPRAGMERQIISFTELYRKGLVTDGMKFTMKYDGVSHHAKAILSLDKRECYLLLLDENGEPYRDNKGEIIGTYSSSSSAGVDAINYYRQKHGISTYIKTLRGTTYWVNEDGLSVKDLIDRM